MENEGEEEGEGERHIFYRWEYCHYFELVWLLKRKSVVRESNLKATLGEVDFAPTTADIWTANNKSFLAVSSSLDQQFNFAQ